MELHAFSCILMINSQDCTDYIIRHRRDVSSRILATYTLFVVQYHVEKCKTDNQASCHLQWKCWKGMFSVWPPDGQERRRLHR